jgi:branched-chain amino acid aminotransferase
MAILFPPKEGINFGELPWNLNLPDEHFYVHITTTSKWSREHYNPSTDDGLVLRSLFKYSNNPLPLYPAATSLNYGTTIWEGLKCYRDKDGKPCVFRPDLNYKRFARGAHAMCLPEPSKELFLRGIQVVLQANSHIIPPRGDGMMLYVRPMLLGSGHQLGLYPSQQVSLLFFVSPTGNYFKGCSGGLNLHLETTSSRAARGGVGNVKCAGNYAVALRPLMDAQGQGFQDNLFLELETYQSGKLNKAVLQEMTAANLFLVFKSGIIATPSLERGTILPGVTRESVLAIIAKFKDLIRPALVESTGQANVEPIAVERDVTVGDLEEATEAFCTGTAAELVPIARLATGKGEEKFDVTFPHGARAPGPVTSKLLELLRKVMYREMFIDDNWLRNPFASSREFCD